MMKRSCVIFGLMLLGFGVIRAEWTSFFSYDEVNCIAVAQDRVYALSGGSLYSVEKQTERLTKYDMQSGLHATGIVMMHYDSTNRQLLLFYSTGKIDILSDKGVEYVAGLYDKDMMAEKVVYNVTQVGNLAYLATSFGIVTMDLRQRLLIDTYYIGEKAAEVLVRDVAFTSDSIYAFTDQWVGSAAIADNLVDYSVWHRVPLEQSRIQPDGNKGKRVTESNGSVWLAGGNEGIVWEPNTGGRFTYKPDGPACNKPYFMLCDHGRLFVVPGGYWASQNNENGLLMTYENGRWHHVSHQQIASAVGKPVRDLSYIAIDPNDSRRIYASSYGAGVVEFYDGKPTKLYNQSNSTIQSAVSFNPDSYTRAAGIALDPVGNLYVMVANSEPEYSLAIRNTNGKWGGINLVVDDNVFKYNTPVNILVDKDDSHRKWLLSGRSTPAVMRLDDRGTLFDGSDDLCISRSQFVDQDGEVIAAICFFAMVQTTTGDLWIGTEIGPILLRADEDFATSNRCVRLRQMDGDVYLMSNQEIRAIAEDGDGNIWIGSYTMGVYVLTPDAQEIVAHYTSDNSSMPCNTVMSLAWDDVNRVMYIGTAEGLVATGEKIPDPTGVPETSNDDDENMGSMLQWTLHPSFAGMQQVIVGRRHVYGLATGALFAIDKESEDMTTYTKLSGLHGGEIRRIAYNNQTDQLMVVYINGMIDIISDRDIVCMLDLYQKAATMSVTVQDICMRGNVAYLAMPFGVVAIDMRRYEVQDTYYFGADAANVDVSHLVCTTDSLYAFSFNDSVYSVSFRDRMIDYTYWHHQSLSSVESAAVVGDQVYVMRDNQLYRWQNGHATLMMSDSISYLRAAGSRLVVGLKDGSKQRILEDGSRDLVTSDPAVDIDYDAAGSSYWAAVRGKGIVRLSDSQQFLPNGPLSNDAWEISSVGSRIFVCPGARAASQFKRQGDVSVYENGQWIGFSAETIRKQTGWPWLDVVSVTADPADTRHFWAASYGMGIFEYRNDLLYDHYVESNSTLKSSVEENQSYYIDEAYNRTDGLYLDSQSNLWILNPGIRPDNINVRSADGKWASYNLMSGGTRMVLTTPGNILADRRNEDYKWIPELRDNPGVIFHYDAGTPMYGGDDRTIHRNVLYDQDGAQISLNNILCIEQDLNNDLWIGTQAGIVIVPAKVDFFTQNTCYRVKIPRNDGTNLADYLLGTECINAIVTDGGNRKWIATAGSGLYLISEDGLSTIYHFTENNSPLLSDNVLSIAIQPITGEVFVGTTAGICSFRSDASASRDNYDAVYAYPNPVRPDYQGVITITGLMENSFVTIIDGGGNLVCKTRSNGGTAIWDGCLPNGARAATGVYTVLCNAAGSKAHAVTKILFVN